MSRNASSEHARGSLPSILPASTDSERVAPPGRSPRLSGFVETLRVRSRTILNRAANSGDRTLHSDGKFSGRAWNVHLHVAWRSFPEQLPRRNPTLVEQGMTVTRPLQC